LDALIFTNIRKDKKMEDSMKTLPKVFGIVLSALMITAFSGCESEEGPVEKAGEAVEETGEAVEETAEETEEAMEEAAEETEETMEETAEKTGY